MQCAGPENGRETTPRKALGSPAAAQKARGFFRRPEKGSGRTGGTLRPRQTHADRSAWPLAEYDAGDSTCQAALCGTLCGIS
jgi:hypothetical protein